jgi:hypothetical protein
LCCFQPQSAQAWQAARAYSRQVVWWGTIIEAVNSLNRLTREATLTVDETRQAFARLDYMRSRWNEVQPTEECESAPNGCSVFTSFVRRTPSSLLLLWSRAMAAREVGLIGADGNLSEAAGAEGFTIIRLL